jgi:putative flippase GtrA
MRAEKRSQWSRWGIFNVVGLLGFGVQLLALFLLKHVAGLDYRLATACAVEIAVLHNFFWHEHLTWADVVSALRGGVWDRLLRFHAANGFISLFGNVTLTWILVRWTPTPYLAANAASVAICSVLNFVVGDRLVFRKGDSHRVRALLHRGACDAEFS